MVIPSPDSPSEESDSESSVSVSESESDKSTGGAGLGCDSSLVGIALVNRGDGSTVEALEAGGPFEGGVVGLDTGVTTEDFFFWSAN